jgi:hypothetical protein
MVASWESLAHNAALGEHTGICVDIPVIPREPGPHAEGGGGALENMHAHGCTLADSNISGRAGGQDSVSGVRSGPAGIASKDPRTGPT